MSGTGVTGGYRLSKGDTARERVLEGHRETENPEGDVRREVGL